MTSGNNTVITKVPVFRDNNFAFVMTTSNGFNDYILTSLETKQQPIEQVPPTQPTSADIHLELAMVIQPYQSGGKYYYNHTRTFIESNGVGVNITSGQVCYSDGHCDSQQPTSYNIPASGTFSLNRLASTTYSQEKFVYKYWGTDNNGNSIQISSSLCVNGLNTIVNC
jgi:hypothetical protein